MLPDLKSDLKSSIVVFLVALPLCLGIALASNAPLGAGLIAGILGGIVVSFLSASPLSVSGPAAGLAVIVANGISEMGDFKAFSVAIFIAGLLQVGFSLLRAGVIGNFFPSSVIKGMLSAIGLILILKQVPHALGFDSSYMGSEAFFESETHENTFSMIIRAFGVFDLECVIITLVSLAIILFWDRLSQKTSNTVVKSIPSALIAVLSGIFLNHWAFSRLGMGLESKHLVQLPFNGGIQDFLGTFSLPDWSVLAKGKTYAIALTLAIVGSLESLLSLDAADKIDPQRRSSSKNRELLAQGVGNTLSGALGGLPITAVIVRTSANISSGAKTKVSGMLHGGWLLLSILFIPGIMNQIPLSVLATILILVGYKLTKPGLYLKMYRNGFDQFIPFASTIIAILVTDLLKGILFGMAIGFIFVIKRSNHRAIVMVKDDENINHLIRFTKDISFLNKHELMLIFRGIPNGSTVIIDGGGDIFVDDDIIDLIEDFAEGAPLKNIKLTLKKSKASLSPFFRG
jgi:SulP family sulfate permease